MRLVGSRRVLAVTMVCAALAAATTARAAEPSAAAVQQLLASQKETRSSFRAALAAANAQASSAIGTVELGFASSQDATAAGNALFDALKTFQVAVDAALVAAANAQANAAQALLSTLGSDLGGVFPRGFYPGDLTPAAALEQAIDKDLAKAYARLRKRLARVSERFEDSGFGLTFRVRAPRTALPARRWSETEIDFLLTFEARIDLALAWSELAVPGDGQLRVAGGASANPSLPDVAFSAYKIPTFHDESLTRDGNRFSTEIAGTPLDEGVWLLVASQGMSGASELTIGVR